MDNKRAHNDRSSGAVFGGVVAALLGAALILGAGAILTEDRDTEGFTMSEPYAFESVTRAIVAEDAALSTDAPLALTGFVTNPGDLRVRTTSSSEKALFMGVAATADVQRYLAGAPHQTVTVDFDGSAIAGVDAQTHAAAAVPKPPGDQDIWVAWTASDRPQTLHWSLEPGEWSVVIMNSDASSGVAADLALGSKPSNLTAIAWLAIAAGIAFAIGGGYAIYRGLGRPAQREQVIDLEEAPFETPEADKEPVHAG